MRDTRYHWAHLFGAVCPDRGVGAGLVMPYANTEAMNRHLEEIAKAVSPGAHAVLVLDGAGWHDSSDWSFRKTSRLSRCRPTHRNSIPSRISGNICARTSSPTGSTKLTRTSSEPVRSLEQPHGNTRSNCLRRQSLGKGVMTYGGWFFT